MTPAYATTALLIAGIITLGNLFVPVANLGVTPPNVLDSDLDKCECYQEDVYPNDCPLSTPQLDELCSNLTGYQYNHTLTEQFCNQSCLEALTSCYKKHPVNCSTNVLEYYKNSFCSRNQMGEYCVSVGVSALEQLPVSVTSCSVADIFCPLPPETCPKLQVCSNLLNFVVEELGCCAQSLFYHPLSPFANFSIGNPHAYDTCDVTLGEECSVVHMETSPVPSSSMLSPSATQTSPVPSSSMLSPSATQTSPGSTSSMLSPSATPMFAEAGAVSLAASAALVLVFIPCLLQA